MAIDRNGNVHQYSYDVLGRLTSDAVTMLGAGVDGSVRRIGTAYDSQGNLLTTTDPLGNSTVSTYNNFNEVLTKTSPLSETTSFDYDANGVIDGNDFAQLIGRIGRSVV